jgi:hypothetical protein
MQTIRLADGTIAVVANSQWHDIYLGKRLLLYLNDQLLYP